jgi:predicted nucleotidyltransferase
MTYASTSNVDYESAADLGSYELRSLICAAAVQMCTTIMGSRLRAIVLTGSLARNEATFSASRSGFTFLSDADFLLVLEERMKDPSPPELHNLEELVEARLLEETAISVHVGFATVSPHYFRGLLSTSFTYELKNNGMVIWGDAHILELIPYFPKSALSKEDAWRTLNHRIIELIATLAACDLVPHRSTPRLEYALVKLYLDMATSLLLFLDRYQPTYSARLDELRKPIVEHGTPPRFDQKAFCDRVSKCTARKLAHVPFQPEETAILLEEAVAYARELWFWETNLLCGSRQNCPVAEVIAAMGRLQSFTKKQRAWTSLVRRIGVPSTAKRALRWTKLYRLATPRYLVYAASFQLFCAVPQFFTDHHFSSDFLDPAEICALLPVLPEEPAHTLNWTSLAAHTNWCYQKFLVGTVS